ncbi:sensor histidine kinase, partial [Staphylococcus aureus]
IEKKDKEFELWQIAEGINQMMDSVNEYIASNYRLENEQKDANMRALQSQINPHFLYNTLEYIRMYAVNIGAKELANVVF